MPAPIRINLTEQEDRTRSELSYADAVPYRTRQRAMALRLNAHRWKTPEIAHYLDWHEHTVRATRSRWQEVGLRDCGKPQDEADSAVGVRTIGKR